MKRDWNIIKELLLELEPLHQYNGLTLQVYYLDKSKSDDRDIHKFEMAKLLIEKQFIKGTVSETNYFGGYAEIHNMILTFDGHDLLDKLNDETLWKKITLVAKTKGIDVTFTTLSTLAIEAMKMVVNTGN
jgi:hypothetical protein